MEEGAPGCSGPAVNAGSITNSGTTSPCAAAAASAGWSARRRSRRNHITERGTAGFLPRPAAPARRSVAHRLPRAAPMPVDVPQNRSAAAGSGCVAGRSTKRMIREHLVAAGRGPTTTAPRSPNRAAAAGASVGRRPHEPTASRASASSGTPPRCCSSGQARSSSASVLPVARIDDRDARRRTATSGRPQHPHARAVGTSCAGSCHSDSAIRLEDHRRARGRLRRRHGVIACSSQAVDAPSRSTPSSACRHASRPRFAASWTEGDRDRHGRQGRRPRPARERDSTRDRWTTKPASAPW